MNRNNINAITLIELLIGITVVSIMVLSFYSIDSFSRGQLMNSDRRAKVQNELAYTLEHMAKYVQRANGYYTGNPATSKPAIEYFPPANPTGFRVRVDINNTPSDTSNDVGIMYRFKPSNPNVLEVICDDGGTGSCLAFFPEFPIELTNKILANFSQDAVLPDPLPANPPAGFYVDIDDQGSSVNIGLIGRYKPTEVFTPVTKLANPQVAMKTKIICNSASAN